MIIINVNHYNYLWWNNWWIQTYYIN